MSRCHFHERAQTLPREMAADIALPAIDRAAPPLLRFDDLGKVFKQQGHDVHALVGVSAAIWPGETLGLVGESGSGKTTLARTLLGLWSGRRPARSRSTAGSSPPRSRSARADDMRALQIVFQNPDSALNRRHQVRRILRRSLKKLAGLTGAEAETRMLELMQLGAARGTLRQRPARASSRAGSSSGSRSRARSPAIHSSSSATSRPRRSTSRCRRRS